MRVGAAALGLIVSWVAIDAALVQTAEHRSPITLRAASEIAAGSNTEIRVPTTTPVDFIVEIVPTQGTLRVQFDGELVAQWDSTTVTVGQPFQMDVEFGPPATTRQAEVRFAVAYYLRPSYWINLNQLYNAWPGLENPFEGTLPDTLRERLPVDGSPPEATVDYRTEVATGELGLFLLGDANTLHHPTTVEDTVSLSVDAEILPCLRLQAAATVTTRLEFSVGTDTLCVRYELGEAEPCWAATDGFDCRVNLGTWTFDDNVLCEESKEVVIPICPVRAVGEAGIKVATKVELDMLEISHTCDPTVTRAAEPDTASTLWLDQTVEFATDRDHTIFSIPVVPQTAATVTVRDDSGSPMGFGDTLLVDSLYSILWDELDPALYSCCTSLDSLRIRFRGLQVAADSTGSGACFGTISPQVADEVPRSVSWTVPDSSCFDGREARIFLEWYCPPGDQNQILHRAWSENFIVYGGSP